MSNFKIGEKVVYIGGSPNKELIEPKINEIVTVKGYCDTYDGNIDIEEYQYSKDGSLQSFASFRFRKLDHQFGEDVCAEILKKVKEESLISVN